MTKPKYLYGRMHFEDGYRPVLMWRGTKYWHAIYIDGVILIKRYVLFSEAKYFKEWANSNDDLREIKRIAGFMWNRSKCCGLRREMNKTTRKILKECRAYENPECSKSNR